MIESILYGSKYRFCKTDKGNYWVGVSGMGHPFPGANTTAPMAIWSDLQKSAIEAGHSKEEFITEKPEKKSRVRAEKKSNGPSISIF